MEAGLEMMLIELFILIVVVVLVVFMIRPRKR